MERDIKDEDFYEIVSCLTYEPFKTGDIVFDWGKLPYFLFYGHFISWNFYKGNDQEEC